MSNKYHDLKVLMFARKKTQRDIAEVLNITEASVNAKLNGRSDFTIREAETITEYLEIQNPVAIFFKPELRGA